MAGEYVALMRIRGAVNEAEAKFHFRGVHGTYLVETDSGKRDAGIQSAITLEPDGNAHTLVYLR